MRTLTQRVPKYAAAVNLYLGDYRERLSTGFRKFEAL